MEYLKVKEFAEVVTGGTPSTDVKEYWENGTIPWIQSGSCKDKVINKADRYITDKGLKNSSAKLMPKDTVVIALTGATAGKIGLLNIETSANQSVTGILPNKKCTPLYLFYYLISIREKILSDCYGGAQKHISQGYVKDLLIPIPELTLQKKIVSKISKISEMIAIKNKQLIKFDKLVKSQFVEMFKGKNTPDYTKKIEELCSEMMIGPFGSALHKDEISTSGDVFVLGTDNAVENFFSKKEIRYIDNNKYQQLKKYTVKPDDIIISMMGTIGRTAVIPNDLEPAIISSHLCCLTPDKSKIYPDFLQKEFVLDDGVLYQIHSNKKGAIMSGLNLGIIKNITIHYPDLNKQKEFLNIVKQIDKQKFEFEKQLKKLEELQASLMQEYFG